MLSAILGIKKYLIGGVVIIALATSGYFYVQSLRSEVKQLEQETATLSSSNKNLKTTLDDTVESYEKQSKRVSNLQTRLQESEKESNELRRILLDHDLTNLALEKPGLIEKRINDATKDVFSTLESDTTR